MDTREWTAIITELRQYLNDGDQSDAPSNEARRRAGLQLLERLYEVVEEHYVAGEALRQQHEELATTAAALEHERTRYRELFAFAPEGYLVTTSEGIIHESNHTAARLLHTPVHTLQGKSFLVYIAQRDRALFRHHLYALRQHPARQEWEVSVQPRERAPLPVALSVAPARDSSGAVVGFRWSLRDITARTALEEQLRTLNATLEQQVEERTQELRRSNAELEHFAHVVSHDLQEPLRTIRSFAHLLAQRCRGTLASEAEEFLTYIVDGAARMQELIQALLEYARLGRKELMLRAIAMDALVERTLSVLHTAIAESGAVITADPLPTVMADATQVGQVWQNVLSNALKFRGPEPPRVHLSATQHEGEWVFAVRDNGIGLNPQFATRIFAMFQRLHTTAEYPCTGIGLAICKNIIERHGGRIWVESEPGQGATFFFTLPAVPGEPSAER